MYPVEHSSWDELVNKPANPSSSTRQGHEKSFYLNCDNPLSTTLRLDLSPSKVMKGGFKIAAFGTSTTRLFESNTADICAKRTYHSAEHVLVERDGSFITKSDDIPYEGRKQFQNLSMEIACMVWAQALLDLVYAFIAQEDPSPFNIPEFRFVKLALAMEGSPDGTKKQNGAVFLVEEIIAEEKEGPFRKYLNNVSPIPLTMTCKEDETRAKFLAFSQHVQYWKTKKQVFVSDYQGKEILYRDADQNVHPTSTGGNSLLTDPQISSAQYDKQFCYSNPTNIIMLDRLDPFSPRAIFPPSTKISRQSMRAMSFASGSMFQLTTMPGMNLSMTVNLLGRRAC